MLAAIGHSRRWGRWAFAVVVAAIALANPLTAQEPGFGIPIGLPESLSPTLIETAPYPPNPNPAIVSATPTEPILEGLRPLPGTLGDTLEREYAARELFRHTTWRQTVWTLFPTSLLWEPPMASRREPRMAAEYTSLANYRNDWTLATSIGGTQGLFRAEPIGSATKYQLDIFGVVQTRLSPDDLIAADYRFGFPVSIERGPWHAKIAYEHTSAHLGDEAIVNGGFTMSRYAKDELVLGGGRWFNDCLRLYLQLGWAFYQDLPKEYERGRFDIGFEAYRRGPTGWQGTPYAAGNLELRGEQDYATNLNVQVGWLWRNPELRIAQFRVYGGYYTGNTQYGQFFETKENFGFIGIAGDY